MPRDTSRTTSETTEALDVEEMRRRAREKVAAETDRCRCGRTVTLLVGPTWRCRICFDADQNTRRSQAPRRPVSRPEAPTSARSAGDVAARFIDRSMPRETH